MADCTVKTVCTDCAHRSVCKWKEKFLKLVQIINETQCKYGADVIAVAEPVKVMCRERRLETATPRIGNEIALNAKGFSVYCADHDVLR